MTAAPRPTGLELVKVAVVDIEAYIIVLLQRLSARRSQRESLACTGHWAVGLTAHRLPCSTRSCRELISMHYRQTKRVHQESCFRCSSG